jgi:hypothetical protein
VDVYDTRNDNVQDSNELCLRLMDFVSMHKQRGTIPLSLCNLDAFPEASALQLVARHEFHDKFGSS